MSAGLRRIDGTIWAQRNGSLFLSQACHLHDFARRVPGWELFLSPGPFSRIGSCVTGRMTNQYLVRLFCVTAVLLSCAVIARAQCTCTPTSVCSRAMLLLAHDWYNRLHAQHAVGRAGRPPMTAFAPPNATATPIAARTLVMKQLAVPCNLLHPPQMLVSQFLLFCSCF